MQEALRRAEAFIITVDAIFSKAYRDELLEGIVSENVVSKIERLKVEHKTALVAFRNEFDVHMQNDRKIK